MKPAIRAEIERKLAEPLHRHVALAPKKPKRGDSPVDAEPFPARPRSNSAAEKPERERERWTAERRAYLIAVGRKDRAWAEGLL